MGQQDEHPPIGSGVSDESYPEERGVAKGLTRPKVDALDDILGKPFYVLDDGFVRLLDYMGDDAAVVQAARISYGVGTKRVHEDRSLIRYLMRHSHTTPFEMCEIKFHVRVPMDTWRQWIRHRTANVNEYSTRYSVAIDAAQRTEPNEWRMQALGSRQGSGDILPLELGQRLSAAEQEIQKKARQVYNDRLQAGVAREQARKDLPLSTYTEAYWKIDLHNLFHFLWLRMAPTAQFEIRSYANAIGHEIVSKWCPLAWQAFVDYRLNSVMLSRIDAEVIRAYQSGGKDAARNVAEKLGLISPLGKEVKRNREREELEDKLEFLAIPVPWQSQ